VSHRVRFSRFIPALAIVGVVLTMVLSMPLLGTGSIAAQGNSQDAYTCQKGSWQYLQTTEGVTFANQGECVSAAAQGAVLVPISVPNGPINLSLTVFADARGYCHVRASVSNAAPGSVVSVDLWVRWLPFEGEEYFVTRDIRTDGTGAGEGEFYGTFKPNRGEFKGLIPGGPDTGWIPNACR
jgi:hypothetical protein